jgi:hypothetical protein
VDDRRWKRISGNDGPLASPGDVRRMVLLVSDVERGLAEAIELAPAVNQQLTSELAELHSLIKPAWEEIVPRFGEMTDWLQDPENSKPVERLLRDRRLAAARSHLKLAVYHMYSEEYHKACDAFAHGCEAEAEENAGAGLPLHRLLMTIDRILKSMEVIPGALAVRQFTGLLEEAVRPGGPGNKQPEIWVQAGEEST